MRELWGDLFSEGTGQRSPENSVLEALQSASGEEFEGICYDLLTCMGFFNVVPMGDYHDRDRGRDFEASYARKLPDGQGQVIERWFFECKHQKRNLSVDDIHTKVAWADASNADFLVFLTVASVTSSARQFIEEFQKAHGLRILTWTGPDLIRLLLGNPGAIRRHLSSVFPREDMDVETRAQERVQLARSILTAIGILDQKNSDATSGLLEELMARCVRKEDIEVLKMESLGDSSSEIVYVLGARGNRLLNDKALCKALSSILDRHPSDDIAWQIAKYFRSRTQGLAGAARRYILIGPIASGKSCLLAGLLFRMVQERRFRFHPETMLHLYRMHRSIREGRLLPATDLRIDIDSGFRMFVETRKRFTKREEAFDIIDTSGEFLRHFNDKDYYFGHGLAKIVRPQDTVLLIFDPSGRRNILGEDDGLPRHAVTEREAFKEYQPFLEWAFSLHINILPVVTKADLIDKDELKGSVLPKVKQLFPAAQNPIFFTSVLRKQEGQIIPQSVGLDDVLEYFVLRT